MKLYSFIRFLVVLPIRLIFRLKIEGRENIPDEAFLVCANHISAVDPLLLAIAFPKPIRFVGKEEILQNPFWRLIGKIAHFIPINRGSADLKAIRTCMSAIKDGQNVGIFPQGTRIKSNPTPESALPGTGLIILRTKAPVVPVAVFAKEHKVKAFRKTRVVIGKPVYYEEYSANGADSAEATMYCFKKVCEQFEEN